MKKTINTIRLARNLRKGQHEKIALQKLMDRIRGVSGSLQAPVSSEDDSADRKESHGQVNIGEAHIQDAGL